MNLPRYLLAAGFVAVGLAGGALLMSRALEGDAPAFQAATVLPGGRALSPQELVDDRGRPFTVADLEGRFSLLFFGFTRCPDICPLTLQRLAAARQHLMQQGAEELPQIILISVDPEHDDPATLADYLAGFGDGVRGVTGDPEAIRGFGKPLGIHFEKQPGNAADAPVNHSSAVLAVNREAELTAVFGAPHKVEAFVHDLRLLMATR